MNNKNLVKKETTSNLQHCKQQLETVQQDILRDSQHRDPVQVAQMLVVTEKAKHQLERDDKPLTKNDMIAILVALGAVPLREMDTVEATQTVPELISQIRGTVYDVERLVGCGSGGGGRGKALPAASVPALPSSRAALPSPLLPPSKPPRFMAIKNF
jgi:hypothetical protein